MVIQYLINASHCMWLKGNRVLNINMCPGLYKALINIDILVLQYFS